MRIFTTSPFLIPSTTSYILANRKINESEKLFQELGTLSQRLNLIQPELDRVIAGLAASPEFIETNPAELDETSRFFNSLSLLNGKGKSASEQHKDSFTKALGIDEGIDKGISLFSKDVKTDLETVKLVTEKMKLFDPSLHLEQKNDQHQNDIIDPEPKPSSSSEQLTVIPTIMEFNDDLLMVKSKEKFDQWGGNFYYYFFL